MNPQIIARTDQFRVVSYGNGAAYAFQTITFNPDDAREVFLQGDDAVNFRNAWEALEACHPEASINCVLSRLWFDYEEVARSAAGGVSNNTEEL